MSDGCGTDEVVESGFIPLMSAPEDRFGGIEFWLHLNLAATRAGHRGHRLMLIAAPNRDDRYLALCLECGRVPLVAVIVAPAESAS